MGSITSFVQLRHKVEGHPDALTVREMALFVLLDDLRSHAGQSLHELSEHQMFQLPGGCGTELGVHQERTHDEAFLLRLGQAGFFKQPEER